MSESDIVMVKCKVCGGNTGLYKEFNVRNKYKAESYKCAKCEFIFFKDPVWLNEAYEENSITDEDSGLFQRNILFRNLILALMYFKIIKLDSKILDFAGGYGLLVKLLRVAGVNAYWLDKYTENIFSKQYKYTDGKIDLLTAFEFIEHVENPIKQFDEFFKISDNVLISTQLHNGTPGGNWEYFGLNHGQHISFFTYESLSFIAKRYNLNLISFRYIHFFSKRRKNVYVTKVIMFLTMFFSFDYFGKFFKGKQYEN